MKNNDPMLVLIAAAVITLEALLALVVAGLALLLTLAQWRPAAAAEPPPIKCQSSGQTPVSAAVAGLPKRRPALAQQVPQSHPLALIAADLELLPAAALRSMAGIRSKHHTKAALVALVAACS